MTNELKKFVTSYAELDYHFDHLAICTFENKNSPGAADVIAKFIDPIWTLPLAAHDQLVLCRGAKFKTGDRVRNKSGSEWSGKIVGFYSTELTPIGYVVESETHKGSVQIYPESALVKRDD